MTGSRNRDVPKPGVKKIRVYSGVGIDQDSFRGETLRAVAGKSVAVVEMAMLSGIEFNLPIIVEAGINAALWRD